VLDGDLPGARGGEVKLLLAGGEDFSRRLREPFDGAVHPQPDVGIK